MNKARKVALLQLGERTTEFYRQQLISQHVDVKVEVITADFELMNHYLPDHFDRLAPMLEGLLLGCTGADAIVIPNITLHETIDFYCQAKVRTLPIIHPVSACLEALRDKDSERIAIVGSAYTMQSNYLAEQLIRPGASRVVPSIAEQNDIDEYRLAVYQRRETPQQRESFARTVNELGRRATVIVACTELSIQPIFINRKQPAGLLDLTDLQIRAVAR